MMAFSAGGIRAGGDSEGVTTPGGRQRGRQALTAIDNKLACLYIFFDLAPGLQSCLLLYLSRVILLVLLHLANLSVVLTPPVPHQFHETLLLPRHLNRYPIPDTPPTSHLPPLSCAQDHLPFQACPASSCNMPVNEADQHTQARSNSNTESKGEETGTSNTASLHVWSSTTTTADSSNNSTSSIAYTAAAPHNLAQGHVADSSEIEFVGVGAQFDEE
ncbi:hypothetical protein MRB53_039253 [Persea americana]|nr:hypothetical protein MRB53_039253 [Persea americana]